MAVLDLIPKMADTGLDELAALILSIKHIGFQAANRTIDIQMAQCFVFFLPMIDGEKKVGAVIGRLGDHLILPGCCL